MEFSLEISKKVQGFVEFVQKQQKSWLTFEKYGQAEKKYRWAHTCPFGSLEKCFIFPGKKGPLHWTSWPLWKNCQSKHILLISKQWSLPACHHWFSHSVLYFSVTASLVLTWTYVGLKISIWATTLSGMFFTKTGNYAKINIVERKGLYFYLINLHFLMLYK